MKNKLPIATLTKTETYELIFDENQLLQLIKEYVNCNYSFKVNIEDIEYQEDEYTSFAGVKITKVVEV